MQTISPALQALLRSKFQAGAEGFRARVEVDRVTFELVEANQALAGTMSDGGGDLAWDNNPAYANDGDRSTPAIVDSRVIGGGTHHAYLVMDCLSDVTVSEFIVYGGEGFIAVDRVDWEFSWSDDGSSWTAITLLTRDDVYPAVGGDAHQQTVTFDELVHRYFRIEWARTTADGSLSFQPRINVMEWQIPGTRLETVTTTVDLRPIRVSIEKGRRLGADQAELEFENEGFGVGWGPGSLFVTNSQLRVFQWYGDDPSDAVCAFNGIVDRHRDHRDVLRTTVSCRDRFALLLDQTFSSTGPQGADETGAIRTEANGVYLNREVGYIVNAILDAAGWPTDDRAISDTSYVLDEFIVSDGASWAATIQGDERLSGMVGYDAYTDEAGIFTFVPSLETIQADTDTAPVPVYTYEVSTASADLLTSGHVLSLDDDTDQYDLRTRVKVRGPFVTSTLKDAWTELWRTNKIRLPVGIWYAAAEPTIIRVLDRGTKKMYRLRQSDQVILGSSYLGGVIPYPLGLSGDPSDATIYWVLNAPWRFTGVTSGNSVKKVRKSDNHVLASYSIPNGRWSAVKVSAAHVWLTNLDTDRFYSRSKTTLAAVADYRHTYSAVAQSNPSGIMVDGTTLYLFWSNGGTTARFLVCEESDPDTITKVIRTAGTELHGGEMDTTTHTECYGDSDSLSLVAKFTLVEPVETRTDVATEVIDADLEDELGILAGLASRDHDAHPGVDPHPFEIRRETLNLDVITSLAQATDSGRLALDRLSRRRRVLDVGTIGNPALQKPDLIRLIDALTGIETDWLLDTYRTEMSDTYVGTMALLPIDTAIDSPDDDGEGS